MTSPQRASDSRPADLNQQLAQHLLFHQLGSLGCLQGIRVRRGREQQRVASAQNTLCILELSSETDFSHRIWLDVAEASHVRSRLTFFHSSPPQCRPSPSHRQVSAPTLFNPVVFVHLREPQQTNKTAEELAWRAELAVGKVERPNKYVVFHKAERSRSAVALAPQLWIKDELTT